MTVLEDLRRRGGLALGAVLIAAVGACSAIQGPHERPQESGEVVIGHEGGQAQTLLLMPVDGGHLSSSFGYRTNPMGGGGTKRHLGTDYGAKMGAPIRAAGDGIVASVGPRGSYGNYVLIRHNHTYATGYAHMSAFAAGLSAGDRVHKSEVIGYVGSTGRSTGPHLHFEVYDEGERIDPYELPTLSAATEASGQFDVKDSASAQVTRNPDGTETLASKSWRLLDQAGTTIAAATETISASLGIAGETLSDATDEFSHSDTGKQLSAWGHQAQIAFEDRVLSQVDLERLFDGFGEEDPDVIHE
jgi:Peptidase family M23